MALSSAEGEPYAAVKASAESLGWISMMRGLGCQLAGEVWGDAGAALGVTHRHGLGKTRHISVHDLWLQQKVRDGALQVAKVHGSQNTGDIGTKPLGADAITSHMQRMGFSTKTTRA